MEKKDINRMVDELFGEYDLPEKRNDSTHEAIYQSLIETIADLQKQAKAFLATTEEVEKE